MNERSVRSITDYEFSLLGRIEKQVRDRKKKKILWALAECDRCELDLFRDAIGVMIWGFQARELACKTPKEYDRLFLESCNISGEE